MIHMVNQKTIDMSNDNLKEHDSDDQTKKLWICQMVMYRNMIQMINQKTVDMSNGNLKEHDLDCKP